MILLNFGHPLKDEHIRAIEQRIGKEVSKVEDVVVQIDPEQPLVPQVIDRVDSLGWSGNQWQTEEIIVNLPSLNVVAAVLLAELHGRMGYFPPIVRLRPVEGALPLRFEVAEIVNLQGVRDRARQRRGANGNR